jgi:hypothetical protein
MGNKRIVTTILDFGAFSSTPILFSITIDNFQYRLEYLILYCTQHYSRSTCTEANWNRGSCAITFLGSIDTINSLYSRREPNTDRRSTHFKNESKFGLFLDLKTEYKYINRAYIVCTPSTCENRLVDVLLLQSD